MSYLTVRSEIHHVRFHLGSNCKYCTVVMSHSRPDDRSIQWIVPAAVMMVEAVFSPWAPPLHSRVSSSSSAGAMTRDRTNRNQPGTVPDDGVRCDGTRDDASTRTARIGATRVPSIRVVPQSNFLVTGLENNAEPSVRDGRNVRRAFGVCCGCCWWWWCVFVLSDCWNGSQSLDNFDENWWPQVPA